ncbi:MAG: hypothetical protein ACT4OJ_06355 [Bacteroidota bacterium]
MGNTLMARRNKLYSYLRVADEKKINAIYNLLEDEIEQTSKWWEGKKFLTELDSRDKSLTSGKDKGVTVQQARKAIEKLRTEKYGRA